MAEKLLLTTNKKPTFWNQDIWTGLGVAALIAPMFPLIGITPAILFSSKLSLGGFGLLGAGGLLGGIFGKNKMEKDLEHGKEVSPPSRFNIGIIRGLGKAMPLNMAIAGLALGLSYLCGAGPIITGLLAAGSYAGPIGLGFVAFMGTMIASGIACCVNTVSSIAKGSTETYQTMTTEYQQALDEQQSRVIARERAKERQIDVQEPAQGPNLQQGIGTEQAAFATRQIAQKAATAAAVNGGHVENYFTKAELARRAGNQPGTKGWQITPN